MKSAHRLLHALPLLALGAAIGLLLGACVQNAQPEIVRGSIRVRVTQHDDIVQADLLPLHRAEPIASCFATQEEGRE